MAAPSADEILELYDELNFPSAAKLRAALLRKGYRVRMKDVEEFVKSQTPHNSLPRGRAIVATSSAPGSMSVGLWISLILLPSHMAGLSTFC